MIVDENTDHTVEYDSAKIKSLNVQVNGWNEDST